MEVDELGDVSISAVLNINAPLSNSYENDIAIEIGGREFGNADASFQWDRACWYFKNAGVVNYEHAADVLVPHTFSSAKARAVGTREVMILNLSNLLGSYKSTARKTLKALEVKWNEVAEEVMLRTLRAKFCIRNPALVHALLATGELTLYERASRGVPSPWTGRCGSFGKLLSVVRAELRSACKKAIGHDE